jgi:hypothetical protein
MTEISLGEKQELFSENLAKLILFTNSHPGWKIRLGEGLVRDTYERCQAQTATKLKSLHLKNGGHFKSIAIDLNLFIDGQWISNGSNSAWNVLGDYWKSLHGLNRWGGDFQDANHFSMIDGGVA